MGYENHRNPSGLHNLVRHIRDRKDLGIRISMYETIWEEFDKALKYTCELGYVPETFWEYTELDEEFIREDIKNIWKSIFKTPYLSFRPGIKSSPLGWKIFTKRLRNYLKTQKKHYARMYFAEVIAYWIHREWYINEEDLESGHEELDNMVPEIWKKSWIQNYNKRINP